MRFIQLSCKVVETIPLMGINIVVEAVFKSVCFGSLVSKAIKRMATPILLDGVGSQKLVGSTVLQHKIPEVLRVSFFRCDSSVR